uniref:C-C motif chemokine n=1 Tax=Stegastes partitus TaxID=144197 RepID=A0A3B5A3N6_9TELE
LIPFKLFTFHCIYFKYFFRHSDGSSLIGLSLVSLGPENCCFTYYQRKLNKKVIDSYEVTDHRCAKPGVILTVAKSRRICVDPSLSWVEDIMKDLDNERST